MTGKFSSAHCYARLEGIRLIIGNGLFERTWLLDGNRLFAESFLDKRSGRSLFEAAAKSPSLYLRPLAAIQPSLTLQHHDGKPVGQPRLVTELRCGETCYRFEVFAACAGLRMRLIAAAGAEAAGSSQTAAEASGIESASAAATAEAQSDVLESFVIAPLHQRLGEVTFCDRTDIHDNLVSERHWLLSPCEKEISLKGNLFWLEHVLTGEGLVLLKEAPLPHARPIGCPVDGVVRADGTTVFYGNGLGAEGGEGYAVTLLAYQGGATGRTQAIHLWQRQNRCVVEGRDGLLLSNTWGDRSRDARINEPFMRQEIEAGSRLGVEVVQIDDGWQTGRSANSATAGGVWNGFWAADANFWRPHPQRFPSGLGGIVATAKERGMGFGLWFAPDSSNDFANWERDAAAVLSLYQEAGIRFIKIDGVKATTKLGERRLRSFFDTVLERSAGQIVFDFDVTAETRPGYFGLMHVGPIFVENRYTDWHRYWPHRTLRSLWMLSHYVDPVRLRMEFLNHLRHTDKYDGDPLAPANYSAATLFAMVMVASPLGWFENSSLPETYLKETGELVRLWKTYRAELHGGSIFPVGSEPDGAAWSGFLCINTDSQCAHLLAFRQLHPETTWRLNLTGRLPAAWQPQEVELIAGSPAAAASVEGNTTLACITKPLGFAWARIGLKKCLSPSNRGEFKVV